VTVKPSSATARRPLGEQQDAGGRADDDRRHMPDGRLGGDRERRRHEHRRTDQDRPPACRAGAGDDGPGGDGSAGT
jgi:hypothetical protein